MKFYPKKPYQLNSNLTCLVRILSCDIVPKVANGQGADVEKGLHGTGEGQCLKLYLDIN